MLEESMAAARFEGERLVGPGHLVMALDARRNGRRVSERAARFEEILAGVRKALPAGDGET